MSRSRVFFVSVFILIILFAIIIFLPALQGPRINYKYTASVNNLRHIGWALWRYAEDNNDIFPENLEQIGKYIIDPLVLVSSI